MNFQKEEIIWRDLVWENYELMTDFDIDELLIAGFKELFEASDFFMQDLLVDGIIKMKSAYSKIIKNHQKKIEQIGPVYLHVLNHAIFYEKTFKTHTSTFIDHICRDIYHQNVLKTYKNLYLKMPLETRLELRNKKLKAISHVKVTEKHLKIYRKRRIILIFEDSFVLLMHDLSLVDSIYLTSPNPEEIISIRWNLQKMKLIWMLLSTTSGVLFQQREFKFTNITNEKEFLRAFSLSNDSSNLQEYLEKYREIKNALVY